MESLAIEARLDALEKVVCFLVAAQHMQSPDPDAAVARLRQILATDEDTNRDAPNGSVEVAERRLLDIIGALQAALPRRLVDK